MASGTEQIWETARGFQASRILLTAVELGVFATLGDEEMPSGAVAAGIGADARAMDRLMNALVALRLLEKDGDKFRNSPDTRELLVPGKPGYVGGALGHTIGLWDTWSTLTSAVIAGTATLKRAGDARNDWVTPFIAAMHYNASTMSPQVVPLIDLSGVNRVLDVGGGSGAYSIEICRTKTDVEVVVFDLPDVVPLTQTYVSQAGLSDRIATATGDFNIDPLPTGFDLVFMSQILHSNNARQNAELIKKAYRALNPGGKIVVQEFIIDEDRTSPPNAAFFALNMLVGTEAGDTYTQAEVRQWLDDAGLKDAMRIETGKGTTLICAVRHS